MEMFNEGVDVLCVDVFLVVGLLGLHRHINVKIRQSVGKYITEQAKMFTRVIFERFESGNCSCDERPHYTVIKVSTLESSG